MLAFQDGELDANLFPEFAAELGRQWNAWLTRRYATTERVAAAWRSSDSAGPEILVNGAFSTGTTGWRLDVGRPAQATFSVVTDAGAPAARVEVSRNDGIIVFKQVNFSYQRGVGYEATFEARADLPAGQTRSVAFEAREDMPPHRPLVLRTLTLSSQWQRFTIGFTANPTINTIGRFSLRVDSSTGVVLVRNCSLRRAVRQGLAAGESLPSISLVTGPPMPSRRRR